VTHAITLVEVEQGALPTIGEALAGIDGVHEAYSVTGDWDFACIVRVKAPEDVSRVVQHQMAQLPGIRRTHTMLAFEVFSRHDLESLFSIGS
jgi:DNA-binding Lrp family transcriptional regulator